MSAASERRRTSAPAIAVDPGAGLDTMRKEGWLLAAIVALAFLLRLPGFLADPVLLTEGTTYVTLARNLRAGRGYVGILGGPDWFISPFYPVLIAGASFLVSDAEAAGKLISLALGSLLPLPVYWLARQCFGRRPALLAALIVATTPVLVQFSALVWSETTYTFLIFVGLALAWRAMQPRRTVQAVAAGLVLGCAYLTRTEGIIYPAVLAAILALLALFQRAWRRYGVILVGLVGGFLLVAVPYVAALSHHTGRLTLESKGRVNSLVTALMETGLDYHQAAYGLSADGTPVGPFLMRERILTQGWPPDAPALSLSGNVHHLLANARKEVTILRSELLSALMVLVAGFGVATHGWDPMSLRSRSPALLALLALAFVLPRLLLPAWALAAALLFGAGWTRERLAPLAYVIALPLMSLPAVAIAPEMFTRYLVPLLPFAAILAGLGVDRLTTWAAGCWFNQESSLARRTWAESAMGLVLVGTLLLSLPRYGVVDYQLQRGQAQRDAGLWLRAQDASPDKRILSVFSQIPYYAQGVHVPMPDGTPEQVEAYARSQGANYAAISLERLGSRPGLADWEQGREIPSSWLPVYRSGGDGAGDVTIYKLQPIEPSGT